MDMHPLKRSVPYLVPCITRILLPCMPPAYAAAHDAHDTYDGCPCDNLPAASSAYRLGGSILESLAIVTNTYRKHDAKIDG